MVCKGTSVCLVPMEIPGTGVNDGHKPLYGCWDRTQDSARALSTLNC